VRDLLRTGHACVPTNAVISPNAVVIFGVA
jgi:hypothetical protein